MNKAEPYRRVLSADTVLDGVEMWARNRSGYLLRETGQAVSDRRLDGLLVPAGYGAVPLGLTGVEVKVHRSDFLRGLKNGQYEAYRKKLNALYIVTPYGEIKTNEIPTTCGHLVVGLRAGEIENSRCKCVCRRRAPWHNYTPDQRVLWRIIFDLLDQQQKEFLFERQKIHNMKTSIGQLGAKLIERILDNPMRHLSLFAGTEIERS